MLQKRFDAMQLVLRIEYRLTLDTNRTENLETMAMDFAPNEKKVVHIKRRKEHDAFNKQIRFK